MPKSVNQIYELEYINFADFSLENKIRCLVDKSALGRIEEVLEILNRYPDVSLASRFILEYSRMDYSLKYNNL